MLTTRIKIGILFATTVVATGMPIFVHAGIIAQQGTNAFSQTGIIDSYWGNVGGVIQTFATTSPAWSSGTLETVAFYARTDTPNTTRVAAQLVDCGSRNTNTNACRFSGSNYTTLYNLIPTQYNSTSNFSEASTTASYRLYTFTSTSTLITMNPANYYLLVIYGTPNIGLNAIDFAGNLSNTYTGGHCAREWTTDPSVVCVDIADLAFYVTTTNNLSTQGFVINNPTYGEVILDPNGVNFNYDFSLNGADYDKAGFTLVDNTALQSVDTSALEEDIIGSGTENYNQFKDLILNHIYSWTPYLRNDTTEARLYGTTTVFFVGAQSNQSIPEQPVPLWNGCTNILCPGATHGTTTGLLTWNGGTTTTPFGPFGETLDDLLRNKAPFSYLYDIKTVLYELGNGSTSNPYSASCTTSDAYYTLPSGTFGTVLSNGSTTVKIIDACAIKEMSIVQQIRQAMTYAIYLITGIGLTGMAMSMI